jgi:hypothetical protein
MYEALPATHQEMRTGRAERRLPQPEEYRLSLFNFEDRGTSNTASHSCG